jgi:hypothetical protein
MAKEYLSANPPYVVVEKGDTLSKIAEKYSSYISGSGIYGSGGKIETLTKINNISNANVITIGQKIKLSGTADTVKKNTSNKVNVQLFGLQSDTDRTVFVSWSFDKDKVDHYIVRWYYATGDGVLFHGSDTNTTFKHSTYTAPQNAIRVEVTIKPVAKTTTDKNNKTTSPWTGDWSTKKAYSFSSNPPSTPATPTVTIEDYKLTASVSNLNASSTNAIAIQFQVVKDDSSLFLSAKTVKITYDQASFSCNVDAGSKYKVRCRAAGTGTNNVSDWSAYSENVATVPAASSGITKCEAKSKTSVYLEWGSSKTAKTYDIEYATDKSYLGKSDQTTVKTGIDVTKYEISGLETGHEYFFRVRAVNDKGHSAWSSVVSVVLGKKPSAPTTWSLTTTAIAGDPLYLYWIHNSEDGSRHKYSQLELTIDGKKEEITINNTASEEEEDLTGKYSLDTSKYKEGVKILWRVRTAGVTNEPGDWSVQRTIDIYAPPTLTLNVTDKSGNEITTLENFPLYIKALAGPNTQVPLGYHLSVVSNEVYETVDNVGNKKIVNDGEEVYSRYFDTNSMLIVELSANNIDLENNVNYTLTCTATMNSGLTTESSRTFLVAWEETTYEPNAEISIDNDNYTATIMPYCRDEDNKLIKGVTLSVFRRNFDGSFTELASGISNATYTHITDPHPALDYARYRVIATTIDTGAVKYYDVPGVPVESNAIVIQWDEAWSNYDTPETDTIAEPTWGGSMIKLPYNVDISEESKKDVSHVEYIGREHPVSYHGTQLGITQTWNTTVDKSDKETLYALRRLQNWMGNVYVREPSGIGFWATVEPSFNQKHRDVTIPVTLNVTRVEGGV